MQDKKVDLDIIIPCFNPVGDWVENLIRKFHELEQRLPGQQLQMVLVNDGSSTNFHPEHVAQLEAAIPRFQLVSYAENKGKGFALRQGVTQAKAGNYVFTDIDFPYEIDSIVAISEALAAGADVALGFREPDYYKQVPAFRKALSKTLRWTLRNVLRLPITDTQCGLKGFNDRGKTHFLATRINRFLFDLEFVRSVARSKLRAVPVSVKLRADVTFSQMNMRILLPEMINFFWLLIRR